MPAGHAATPGAVSGSGGEASAAGSGGAGAGGPDPNGGAGGALPLAGGPGGAPAGPTDAGIAPLDAEAEAGGQPGCPLALPQVDDFCFREGLMCEYGMECCPDFAWCEFGRWTLLTHHCDACI